jgi:hypothetical protein
MAKPRLSSNNLPLKGSFREAENIVLHIKLQDRTKNDETFCFDNNFSRGGSDVWLRWRRAKITRLAEAASTAGDGSKYRFKILVGTDVTDNCVVLVGTDEAKFAANEKTIDEIWGSFEMWSGGSSGNN